jgi:voltage-gated potassium channel
MGYSQSYIHRVLRLFVNKIYRYPIWIALSISILLIITCSLIIAIEVNIGFFEAFLKVFILFLGELGDIEWDSQLAKLAAAIGLIAGVGFIAIMGAKIVTFYVDLSIRGGRIMKRVNHKNHIIICGWNSQGHNIINQLLSPDIAEKRPIVILANLEKKPVDEDRVDFVSGDPTREEDLKRAGIMNADTAIVLTELDPYSQGAVNPDAQAVLITLAIETLNRDVYTCVQLVNSEYKKHLEHVHVDEYICMDHLSGNLMVASALNHGLSWILNELLEFTSGSEFYKIKVPDGFADMNFRQLAKILHDEDIILMAVETKVEVPRVDEEGKEIVGNDGKSEVKLKEQWIVNPQKSEYPDDYILKQGDNLFVIAIDEPTSDDMKKIVKKHQSK